MIPSMNLRWTLPALMMCCVYMVCTAHAEEEEEMCVQLEKSLREQLEVLQSVTSDASAQAALPALDKVQQELRKFYTQADEAALWRYIDNTPGIKQPLITILEDTMVQLQRIEKAYFFKNGELKRKLKPMVSSAPASGV